MSLKEELSLLRGNKRRFLLLRIADMPTDMALKLCHTKAGTYNNWCNDANFVSIHRRKDELTKSCRQEAIHMLRKDTQVDAILLEARIVQEMRKEIESGEYHLIKTGLAREVYSKLINDLDYQPQTLSLSWEERVQQLFQAPEQQAIEGEIVEVVDGSG